MDVLQENPMVERILSCGQTTDWQDNALGEFVLLLQGAAELEFQNEKIDLSPGDYLYIPAHTRHRVSYTGEATLWLCVWESKPV